MMDPLVESCAANVPAFLAGYKASPGAYDEFLSAPGQPRAAYAGLVRSLERLSPEERQDRWDTCQRLVLEQGLTYNVYGNAGGMERPWKLDPIPLMISAAEWSRLERGLIQRATLLNRILSDCYGSQELIHSRWLAPALVFGQQDFLRPCHGIPVPDRVYLNLYAADLERSPDGQWWVVSDRTQIPTGAGYALANRLVASRILPEAFREHNVHRLAGFFRDLQNSLAALARHRTEAPRIVLLTSGPYNETYFEQVYLARYLGYILVEGQDLVVRDNRVYLKTLGGLEPVDVILRRVDDDFCDPLELRSDSILGVPGLVEAWRAGQVAIANPLGSGLVQSPAFMAFLPGLCRQLLGEDLELPSVATWWCGQARARQYVLEHLAELRVKPAFRSVLRTPDPDAPAGAAELEQLRRRIQFDPDQFVAQERVDLSVAPVLQDGRLVSRPVGLRVYLVATAEGYRVMPGGLTRVSPDAGGQFISMQRGGSSKDTWAMSEKPVEEVSLLRTLDASPELRRTGNNLPSRLADNFFWMGRYAERADATARLLRSTLRRFNPERVGIAMPLVTPLLHTLEAQGQLPARSARPELWQNPEAFESELMRAVFDPARSGSLRQITDHLHRLATLVRDRTSTDMWRVVRRLHERITVPAGRMLPGNAMGVLGESLINLAAFHGLARENMTRAQAWRFLDMGLRLERAIYLATLLAAALRHPESDNPSMLEALLEVADSTLTFRSRYNLLPHMPAVFDLVLLDDKNPRSVLFQVRQLAKHADRLPGDRAAAGFCMQLLQDALACLNRTDPRELDGSPARWPSSSAMSALQQTLTQLPQFSDALAAGYFAHSTFSRTGDNPPAP
ncbi:MAG: circularly permuted type 2 ATP-grasp protein [Verrucomicrobiota bacterium]